MKKLIVLLVALAAINASAYDVTNTVTIISNIYNRISEDRWITNNVKNTHVNYYFTNNVYTVSNVTLLVSQQTFKTNTTVSLDVSQQAIADARAQANRAAYLATNAYEYANMAADESGNAQGYSMSARDYRDEIVSRQQWFDDNFGKMVTNIDVVVTTNIYNPSYVIDKGKYVVDLNSMTVNVGGGKNVKLYLYGNWNSFGYPTIDGVGFRAAIDSGGLAVHYGDPSLDWSKNKSTAHLFFDDLYWSSDGNWYAHVRWYHNNISSAFGTAVYKGAGNPWPPNKHDPYAQFIVGQITLKRIENHPSSSTYANYLGTDLYLWRGESDTSTSELAPVIRYITDCELDGRLSSITNWVDMTFQRK